MNEAARIVIDYNPYASSYKIVQKSVETDVYIQITYCHRALFNKLNIKEQIEEDIA